MFVYTFQNQKSLLRHIVIVGRYLTLYISKPSSQEYNALIKKFNLSKLWIINEYPFHRFLHNPYIEFSAKGDIEPHKHLTFETDDRYQELFNICEFLKERNNNRELRAQEFQEWWEALNEERKQIGNTEFPEDVKNLIENYDVATALIPETEIPTLLSKFSSYLEADSLTKKIDDFAEYTDIFWDATWPLLHSVVYRFSEKDSSNEDIVAHWEALCKCYKYLLAANQYGMSAITPHLSRLLQDLKKVPDEIIQDEKYKGVINNYIKVLDFLENERNLHKIKTLKMTGFAFCLGCAAIPLFLFKEEPLNMLFFVGLAFIFTYSVANALVYAGGNITTLFKNSDSNREQPRAEETLSAMCLNKKAA